jgi:hypothetical protein
VERRPLLLHLIVVLSLDALDHKSAASSKIYAASSEPRKSFTQIMELLYKLSR